MIRFVLFIGIILTLLHPSVTGADPLTVRPKLIVGGDHDCPPYEFLANGKATGFDIELMRAVADVMGFDVEFRLGRWNKVRQDLEQGRIDALAGMFYSADRSRLVDFSVPHTMVTSGIFVRNDSPIRSYADMQGKEIIIQEGDIIHDSMRRNGLASRIVAVADASQVLKLLASGKYDCAVMSSRLQGEYYVKAFGLTNIKFVNTELPQQWYCFAVRKGNQELLSKLDEGLKILKVSGKYREIHEKWFGVYEKKDMWNAVKYYVLAFALVAVLCLAFLVWSRMLKRRVEQRTAELRESEEKFRVLAETIPVAIIVYQGEEMVYLNPMAIRAIGYTEQECLQMKFWDLAHDDFRELVKERGLARLRGEKVPSRYEYKWVTKGGESRWTLLSSARIEFRGKPACIASLIDITERKQMEEELKSARDDLEKRVEERTAELAETVNELLLSQFCIDKAAIGIYRTTFEGDILSANDFACRSLGYTADELRALKVSDIDPVITDEKMLEIKGMLDKSGFASHESVHRRKDGTTFPVEITTNQLEFHGRPYSFSFVRDISERKRAEEEITRRQKELEELNETLENRVREEVEKNREKDIILIQQNRQAALGEMLDHIAHQWKQPLNSISFLVQETEATWACGEMTDEYVSETVAKTTDLVQHMAQTIEVFRDFYRMEKEKTAFSIKDSIDRALSFISPALRFHAIALGLDVDPGLTAIGYPKEYAQVLLNIMTNARDAFVERKTEKPRLEVKAFEEGARAVVTITDNAGGIPDTIIDKVFDLYFTTRESSGGTGVGLYMSKNIIEKNMGGKLSVVNIDNGAQFRIELIISGINRNETPCVCI
jgi:PAS domain S-box-containing protein